MPIFFVKEERSPISIDCHGKPWGIAQSVGKQRRLALPLPEGRSLLLIQQLCEQLKTRIASAI